MDNTDAPALADGEGAEAEAEATQTEPSPGTPPLDSTSIDNGETDKMEGVEVTTRSAGEDPIPPSVAIVNSAEVDAETIVDTSDEAEGPVGAETAVTGTLSTEPIAKDSATAVGSPPLEAEADVQTSDDPKVEEPVETGQTSGEDLADENATRTE